MKRVIVALNIPEDQSTHDAADQLGYVFGGSADPTVWEWQDFFRDVEAGVVSPNYDATEVSS